MKYTVLVVEDEQNQRRALIEKVRWEDAGFQVIGEAENGVEALDLVEQLEPDLILTDIMMPMINGLELAAQVRRLRPATQMVILSGYDRFEFAQTAMNYNIIRYLLKPISSAELSELLPDIRQRMDERLGTRRDVSAADSQEELHRLRVTELILSLMLGAGEYRKQDPADLNRRAEELGILKPGETDPRFCVAVAKVRTESGSCTGAEHREFVQTVVRRYLPCESFLAFGRVVSLIRVEGDGLTHALELPLRELVQSARRLRGEECTVGISREFHELPDCAEAYFQAITARRYTSDGNGNVRFIDDGERDDELQLERAEKSVLQLDQLLKVGKREALEEYVAGLYENNTPENASLLILQIVATVYRLVASVTDRAELTRLMASNPLLARVTSYSSEVVMREELLAFCEQARDIIARTQRRDSEVLCDRVVQIIDEQYGDEELSLTSVSNQLAVSPNYLSALIKKTKKKNFITLLTERRMQAAYDMLVCTPMKILEVSERCGYSDQHYFSYCFKKFYGESPNRVRSTNRSDA